MSDIGRSERRLVDNRRGFRRNDAIEIRGLRVHAYHGVHPEEQREGQTFVIDVALEIDSLIAARTDNLDDTIDYGWLVRHVAEMVRSTRFNLLEALGAHIAERLLAIDRAARVSVRIAKPEVAFDEDVDAVVVTVQRSRPVHIR